MQNKLSNEAFAHPIRGTPFWISRRPSRRDDLSSFDLVIDLTSEFYADRAAAEYICIPQLDGHRLSQVKACKSLPAHGKKSVLVHCANGHGRASLVVAILLKEHGYCNSYSEGLELIQSCRKEAHPNRAQRAWIESL
ncbi:MAG: hypothetical protein GY822_30410 [Deltaproteobacteria bacterium]|nr:hypothetical protein [Deltaproteobacteria bacterium]